MAELIRDSKVTIANVDMTQSTFWAKGINDTTVTASVKVPSGEQYKVSAFLKDSAMEDFEALNVDIIDTYDTKVVINDKFVKITKFSLTIDGSLLKSGTNILRLVVEDMSPAEGSEGKSEYDYDLVVEHRNSFRIDRKLSHQSEYLISGSGTITNENGFQVQTVNGVLRSMVVPKRPIEMDGRATIRGIKVDVDKDTEGACEKDVIVQSQEDCGDYNVQQIPFTEILSFNAIDKVQAINANEVKK